VLVCPTGQTACGGRCVDTVADASHCGRCGNACGATERCATGVCRSVCDAPTTACVVAGSVRCIDAQTDAAHCGRCGNVCAAGLSCVAGSCTLVCPMGRLACAGRCVDPLTDASNCGRCDNTCGGTACVSGSCALAPPIARANATPNRLLRDDAFRTLVTLNATASTGSAITYAWTIPDGRLEAGSSLTDSIVRVRFAGTADQPWTLRVRNSGGESSVAGVVRVNRKPIALAEGGAIIALGMPATATGMRSFDADGDALSWQWTFATRPPGSSAALAAPTGSSTSFTPDVAGTYTLRLVVNDGFEDSTPVTTSFVVEAADQDRPEVTVTVSPSNTGALGSTFTVCVTASDASPIDTRTLTIAGTAVTLASDGCGPWSSSTVGRFEAVGIARDRAGNTGRGSTAIFVNTGAIGAAPTVALTAPIEGAILQTLTDVVGTATDTDLAEWVIELTPQGATLPIVVARGRTAVTAARFTALSPPAFAAGIYDLRLCAEDTFGQRACTTPRSIEIAQRGIRPGALRIGVIDAIQDLFGVELQIARIYDSRYRTVGDFGFGWTLETSAFGRISQLTDASRGWTETGGCGRLPFRAVFREVRTHRWTVTVGRDQQRFRMNVFPEGCITGGALLSASFTPEAGSTGTLVSLDGSSGLIFLNSDQTIYNDDLEPWNPRRYQYTSAAGIVYDFDIGTGLTAIDDTVGTRINFSPTGVSVVGTSAGISFNRDALGRVTRLTLPDARARTYRYDSAGDLVGATDFAGLETRYRYDLDHYLIEVIDPRGAAPASLIFDSEGRVSGVRDATGGSIGLRWDSPERQVTTDRLGNTTTFNYDAEGNVTSVINALGHTTSYTWDAGQRQTSMTNPLGHVTRFEYDARGNRSAMVDPLGNRWVSTYNAQNRLTSRTDPTGSVERFEYGSRGQLSAHVNALGGRTVLGSDSRGRITRVTNPAGGSLGIGLNSAGNLTSYTDALGGTGTVITRPDGQVARETFRFGTADVSWEQSFDSAGRVTGGVTPSGATWSLSYDRAGVAERFTDAEGRAQRFITDGAGNMVGAAFSEGRSVSFSRDVEDRVTAVTMPHGGSVQRTLDALARPTRVTLPNGITTTTSYDAAGRVLTQSTPYGGVESFTYDNAGRPTGATLATGGTVTYEHDTAGRRTALVDALGQRTQFAYDLLGNLARVTFPGSASVATTFDTSNRLTTMVDERGATTRFTYDVAHQIASAQSAAGETTTYSYDSGGGFASATLPSGATWNFTHTPTGSLLTARTPWGGETRWERLASGRNTRTIGADGVAVSYEYDTAGRVTARIAPTAAETERRTYSTGGRAASATGPFGLTTWAHDAQGRIRTITHSDGSFVEYAYDARGRRASVRTPAGTTSYTYDATSGLLLAVDDTLGGRATWSYDLAGRVTTETLPDGTRHTFTRNARGMRASDRVTDSAGAVLWNETYTRDPAGNITRASEAVSARTVDYTFDPAGRVAREVRTGPDASDETFAYDRDDSLSRIGARTFTLDRTQLTGDGTSTYTYDSAGRRTGRTLPGRTETYRYDAFGRLVEVTRTGATPARVTLSYDAEGLLRTLDIDGTRRTLLWDTQVPIPQLLEERDATGRLLAHYVHGLHPVAVAGDGVAVSVLHRDSLGSIRLRTQGGRVSAHLGYSAWGTPTLTPADSTRLRFAGEYWIPELGLTYLRARFYDPSVGRFLTPDPRAPETNAPGTFNPYTYAGNNPVRFADPSGEFSFASVSIAVSIASTLASIALPSFDIAGFFIRGLGLDVPFVDLVGINVQLGLTYGMGAFGVGGGLSLDYATSGGTTLRAVSLFLTASFQFGGGNIERTFPRNRIEAIAQVGPVFGDANEPQGEPTVSAALAISGGLAQKVVQYFRRGPGVGLSFSNDTWRRSAFELSFGIFDNISVSRSGVRANGSFSLKKFGVGASAIPDLGSRVFDGTSGGGGLDLSPRQDFSGAISGYMYFPLWHSLENREFPNVWEMLGSMF
jgi:RHS repeat-associated protein